MDTGADADTMLGRSRLPDPCTLLFGVPSEAPPPVDEHGRQWTLAHWIRCARRAAGHIATPIPGGEPGSTYCGDIDLDGLTYRVHRGPRQRILVQYVNAQGQPAHRFDLEESVWVEPVAPQPLPDDWPWCDPGPPSTFRLASEDDGEDGYTIRLAEHPDGTGRTLMIQFDPDEDDTDASFDTYCLVLDPGQHTFYGGITECVLDQQQQLHLRLTPEAANTLGADPILRFHLDLDATQLALLRAGLHRTLTGGRPDARPQHLHL